MASLGILFNIERLGGGIYGYNAYQILFQAIESAKFVGCQFSDGDVDSNLYCIAIAIDDSVKIAELRSLLSICDSSGLLPPPSRFLDGSQVETLPLVQAAYVTDNGKFFEFSPGWVKRAWEDVQKQRLHEPMDTYSKAKSALLSRAGDIISSILKTLTLDKISLIAPKIAPSDEEAAEKPYGPNEYKPGEILGRGYYVRAVYRGGMGLVYIVDSLRQIREGKSTLLAFKTFQKRFLWSEEIIERFEREAMQWIGLEQHPHIVTAFLVERIEGRPYICLEYVEGESLADRLSRERLDTTLALNLAIQFTRGMRHVYEKHRIIHRDIKPANCLLTHDNILKISDFGLSKLRADLQAQIDESASSPVYSTQVGILVGTPIYMPPEAIADPANVSITSDIYSFGIMFHEMLTGSPVFLKPDVLKQHLHEIPVAPSSVNPDIPKELDEIVLMCLEKDPANRFGSFSEIEAALVELGTEFIGAIPELPEQVLMPERKRKFMKAFTLMEFGRFDEAIDVYQEVLAQNPEDAESLNNFALCLVEVRRYEESHEYFRRAVDLKPDYVEAWANLGGVLNKLARYCEAIEACDRAIALNPNWAEGYANRGVNLTQLGHFDDAIACFDRALEADSKYWKAYLMAAETKARRGCPPEEILELANKALDIHPREPNGLALAAACLIDLGKRSEAEQYIKLAQSVDPDNTFVCRVEELFRKKKSH